MEELGYDESVQLRERTKREFRCQKAERKKKRNGEKWSSSEGHEGHVSASSCSSLQLAAAIFSVYFRGIADSLSFHRVGFFLFYSPVIRRKCFWCLLLNGGLCLCLSSLTSFMLAPQAERKVFSLGIATVQEADEVQTTALVGGGDGDDDDDDASLEDLWHRSPADSFILVARKDEHFTGGGKGYYLHHEETSSGRLHSWVTDAKARRGYRTSNPEENVSRASRDVCLWEKKFHILEREESRHGRVLQVTVPGDTADEETESEVDIPKLPSVSEKNGEIGEEEDDKGRSASGSSRRKRPEEKTKQEEAKIDRRPAGRKESEFAVVLWLRDFQVWIDSVFCALRVCLEFLFRQCVPGFEVAVRCSLLYPLYMSALVFNCMWFGEIAEEALLLLFWLSSSCCSFSGVSEGRCSCVAEREGWTGIRKEVEWRRCNRAGEEKEKEDEKEQEQEKQKLGDGKIGRVNGPVTSYVCSSSSSGRYQSSSLRQCNWKQNDDHETPKKLCVGETVTDGFIRLCFTSSWWLLALTSRCLPLVGGAIYALQCAWLTAYYSFEYRWSIRKSSLAASHPPDAAAFLPASLHTTSLQARTSLPYIPLGTNTRALVAPVDMDRHQARRTDHASEKRSLISPVSGAAHSYGTCHHHHHPPPPPPSSSSYLPRAGQSYGHRQLFLSTAEARNASPICPGVSSDPRLPAGLFPAAFSWLLPTPLSTIYLPRTAEKMQHFEGYWLYYSGFGTACCLLAFLRPKWFDLGLLSCVFPFTVLASVTANPITPLQLLKRWKKSASACQTKQLSQRSSANALMPPDTENAAEKASMSQWNGAGAVSSEHVPSVSSLSRRVPPSSSSSSASTDLLRSYRDKKDYYYYFYPKAAALLPGSSSSSSRLSRNPQLWLSRHTEGSRTSTASGSSSSSTATPTTTPTTTTTITITRRSLHSLLWSLTSSRLSVFLPVEIIVSWLLQLLQKRCVLSQRHSRTATPHWSPPKTQRIISASPVSSTSQCPPCFQSEPSPHSPAPLVHTARDATSCRPPRRITERKEERAKRQTHDHVLIQDNCYFKYYYHLPSDNHNPKAVSHCRLDTRKRDVWKSLSCSRKRNFFVSFSVFGASIEGSLCSAG